MDFAFKLKGFAAEAATALNRAKQFTEERLGHSDRTEFDGYVENQLDRAQQLCTITAKIVQSCEAVVEPNLGSRVEDFLIEKLSAAESKKKERLRNLEWLGQEMVNGGQTFGPGDVYGNALIACGETQNRLGELERQFATQADNDFIKPLKKFLDEDGKALTRGRRILEAKRLDLDAAKNKLKKVKPSDHHHHSSATSNHTLDQVTKDLDEAEEDLRKTQEVFDMQVDSVTAICDKIINSSSEHVKYLSRFIELQAEYYKVAHKDLDNVLNNRTDPGGGRSETVPGAATFAALSQGFSD